MLTELYQSVDPVALSVGLIINYWYGVAYVVGALITGIVMYRTQRRWGLNLTVDDLMMVAFGVVNGLVIGARLFYVIFYGDGFYWTHPLEIFMTNHGGMSFHGGLVGAIVGGAIVCRIYHISAWTIADLAVIGVPIALCLGRCANFVNGELWANRPTCPGAWCSVAPRAMWCVILPSSTRRFSRAWCSSWSLSHELPQAAASAGHIYGYVHLGLWDRTILIEFVRVPDAQLGYILGDVITMGELLSLPLIVIGIGLIAYARHAKRPQRDYI